MIWLSVLAFLKKFGPYIAIALLLVGIYVGGVRHGSEKWKEKYNSAVAQRDRALETADHNYQQWVQSDEARERMAAAVRELESETADAEARVRAAHKAEIARLERENARNVADAQGRADALQERIRELSVGDSCHEAMLEIVK